MSVQIPRGLAKCKRCERGPFVVRKSGSIEGHKCPHDVACKPCEIDGAAPDVPNCLKCHFARHQEATAVTP